MSNVGSNTPAVKDLHYFGEHTPERIDGESAMNRQKRILDEYSRHQMNALNRVRNGESIVMDFSTLGVRAFTKALAKSGRIAPVFPTSFLQEPASEFYDFVKALKKSGADVYVTVLCPPAKLIAERLAYRNRNGDDAWGRSLTNKIAIEYQEVAREIMTGLSMP